MPGLFVGVDGGGDDLAGVLVLEPSLGDAGGRLLEKREGLGQPPGGPVRQSQTSERAEGGGVVGPQLFEPGVADLLIQGDGLRQPPGG